METYPTHMRRGLSLLELLLAIAIAGLLLGIGLPSLASVVDGLAVRNEAWRIVAAHRRARITAVLRSRQVVLTVSADSLIVRAANDPDVAWKEAGPSSSGVTLSGGPKEITFLPIGITVGVANASFTLSRGSAARTVILSRLGRLRME
jgi:prepilin-type N-terminal cleavage/methylation domain-containing protein